MLNVRHLAKRFGNGVAALDGLDFTLADGEFAALLGPSGCGKSTALRLIAGLASPDAGQIAWTDGRPEMGFVFQDATLMPWADIRANVRLPLDIKGVARAKADARAEAALARVGLAGFAQAVPRQLSGGMKMRASIARALVARPRMLLLDEPFAALDEISRAALNDDLLALWRQSAQDGHPLTILFVTHSVAESCVLAERVLVMSPRPGRLKADIALIAQNARPADFRLSPQFLDYQRRIAAALAAS